MSGERKDKEKIKKTDKPVDVTVETPEFKTWINEVYELSKISDEELNQVYELLRYKGFNRSEVLKQLFLKSPDKNITMQLILLVALQGPQRAAKTKLTTGRTPLEMGIPASGQKGTQNLSCARISAATADLAAFFLRRLNVPKRVEHALPGWLQFPTAGSIKLPPEIRDQHKDFSIRFSKLIGGEFNEQIYNTMQLNSYSDPRLRLFEDI